MFTAAAVLWAVVALGQNDGVAAAQETSIFKTGVALVKVDTEVTDGTRVLVGFQKDDFRILDNGTEQPILYFSQGEEPPDLILLFDLSGSMIPRLKKLSESAHAALAKLRNGDRVSVMVFGSKSSSSELRKSRQDISSLRELLGPQWHSKPIACSKWRAAQSLPSNSRGHAL
jgi:hypothetical protein